MSIGTPVPEHVHLVGIGGEGMMALAHYLLDKGHSVSGSDPRRNAEVDVLSRRGAAIVHRHDPMRLLGAGMVVYSDAVPASNVECVEARLRDLPVLRRAAFLGLLAADKRAIFVAGSHGKSTTTAMIASVLLQAGHDPSFVIGASAASLGGRRAHYAGGAWLVAEACEAFNNLTPLRPDLAVVTNIDDDHLEHYGSQSRLDLAFSEFLGRVNAAGVAVVNGDDAGVRRVLERSDRPVITFGAAVGNHVRVTAIETHRGGSTFTVTLPDIGPFLLHLSIPGVHTVLNAVAAVAVCRRLDVPIEQIACGLRIFSGVARRWQDHGEVGGGRLVEDYAHHPTELSAAVATARSVLSAGQRLVVAFQPQLYSRTRRLCGQFADSLAAADHVLLLDIDGGGERYDSAVHSSMVAEAMGTRGPVVELVGQVDGLIARAADFLRRGDFLLIAGAGTVGSAAAAISTTTHGGETTARRAGGLRARTVTSPPAWCSVVDLFDAVVRRNPAAQAVVSPDVAMTYSELDFASNRCAQLLRERGITAGSVVAVSLPSSTELVVAALAVAKLGSTYLPIDPTLPLSRARFMAACAHSTLIVLHAGSALGRDSEQMQTLCADVLTHAITSDAGTLERGRLDRIRPAAVAPENAAYICFTSGSTGSPKGVVISHGSLAAFLSDVVDRFDIEAGTRIALNTGIGFDVAIGELWMTLCGGGCLLVTNALTPLVGARLADFLDRTAATHLAVTPSVLRTIPERPLPSLRWIIAAGEVCGPDLVTLWAPGRTFVNAYGPTEATVYATVARCMPGRTITIGTSLAHVTTHVLDEDLCPVAPGAVGELCLSGVGVTRGYLNGGADDDARFQILGDEGTRIYRTGDLVRHEINGELVFVGRRDHQVKLLGNRIELEEIEAAINALPTVRDAAVCLHEDGDHRELVAFVLSDDPASHQADDIRSAIATWLPSAMLPSRIVAIPDMPLTESGKKDRTRLLERGREALVSRPFFSPGRSDVETTLARVWADVLRHPGDAGVYDDFRSLGGDSLKSLLLIAATEEAFGITIPPGYFEGFTNIVNMAVLLEDLLWTRRAPGPELTDGFRATRIYHQQHHLTATWSGARVHDNGLIRSFGGPDASADLCVCVQYEHEILALHQYLGSDFRVHGMRSGHLVMAYTEANVEQLTEHYLQELREIAPSGRLLVAGVCQGGTIAVALSRKLETIDRRPDLLILIEQSRLPAYDGPVAFFYSQDSFLNPAKRFEGDEQRFRSVYGDRYSVDVIDGAHSDLFAEPQIGRLVARLRARLGAAAP